MKTIKQILSENRDLIISLLNDGFLEPNEEELKFLMITFLKYLNEYSNIEEVNKFENDKDFFNEYVNILISDEVLLRRDIKQKFGLAEVCSGLQEQSSLQGFDLKIIDGKKRYF